MRQSQKGSSGVVEWHFAQVVKPVSTMRFSTWDPSSSAWCRVAFHHFGPLRSFCSNLWVHLEDPSLFKATCRPSSSDAYLDTPYCDWASCRSSTKEFACRLCQGKSTRRLSIVLPRFLGAPSFFVVSAYRQHLNYRALMSFPSGCHFDFQSQR